jgi:ADP-ribose pyrophosphatase
MTNRQHRHTPVKRAVESLGRGDWLALERLKVEHADGLSHDWESVRRLRAVGAVLMIARLRPSGRYVLIRQYRPAYDGIVLEFPAGLIDEGESAEETARRELIEETGYHGEILAMSPMSLSSPGITAEGVKICFMDIDEADERNRNPVQDCEETERIEVVLVSQQEIPEFLEEEVGSGVALDSRLVGFFLGIGAIPESWRG